MTTPSVPVPLEAAAAPRWGRRVVVSWLVLSAIATPLVGFVLGPAIRPGTGTDEAAEQVFDNTVLTVVITPVFCLLAVFFAVALVAFRARDEDAAEDGPADRGHSGIQVLWVAITTSLVLFLAGFGTYSLLKTGAGGGQGPSPVAFPPGSAQDRLPVQVIGQQWEFTFRYPTYGGLETHHLVLPAGRTIEFHVTSLDAVHSFWAYELGVKADANPGVDNVAYVTLKGPRTFHIRCAELCGLWHGYMHDTGKVVPPAQFAAWVKKEQAEFAPTARYLPEFAKTYLPDPQRRAG